MKYGTTKKKIVHIISEDSRNGGGGYWATSCGKWISPTSISQEIPENTRFCVQCKKKLRED